MGKMKNNVNSTAKQNGSVNTLESGFSAKGPSKWVDGELTVCVSESAIPVCPNSELGYQPLSDYLVNLYSKRIIALLKLICKERGSEVDFAYWKKVTHHLLACKATDAVQIIPTRAGFGKSTWIAALLLFFIDLFEKNPKQAVALGGCAIVLQKAESLNAMAEELHNLANELGIESPTPLHVLQGWTDSARKRELCLDTSITSFEECHRESCAYAAECPILNSVGRARYVPLIGLTQARFYQIRERGSIPDLLMWEDPSGVRHHRRFLIFDEKPEICPAFALDQAAINTASTELNDLVRRHLATDVTARRLQNSLEYCVSRPFKLLRSHLLVEPDDYDWSRPRHDIPNGFCSAVDIGDDLTDFQNAYTEFSTSFDEVKQKLLTPSLRKIFHVMDALMVDGKSCLFTRQRAFAIHLIDEPAIAFENSLTLVFDATAEVDADYHALSRHTMLNIPYSESKGKVSFHLYSNSTYNVSKAALNKPWAVRVLSAKVARIAEKCSGNVFLLAYKSLSARIWNSLREVLSSEDLARILSISVDGSLSLPYFNGTNGSNEFSKATSVILFGIPRLDPPTYLLRTCAAFGEEALRRELESAKTIMLEHGPVDFSGGKLVEEYAARHLAARYEQEIYRSAIRNPSFAGTVDVHLFFPPPCVVEILKTRFNNAEFREITEPLEGAGYQRKRTRQFGDSPTSFHRLDDFLTTWDGSEILVSDIKRKVSISDAVWKDLRSQRSFGELMKAHQIITKGRGKNCKWVRERNDTAA